MQPELGPRDALLLHVLEGKHLARTHMRLLVRSDRRVLTLILLSLLTLFALSAWAQQNLVSEIEIHGNRRIPAETIKARIFTKPGDVYDAAAIERDFNSLWNTGYFADLRFEREETPKGWRIHIYVKEKPTIREINYEGLSSVSQSDILDRFKERKVGLTMESQYDPTKVKRAEVVIKEMLAEHGRQFATVQTEVRNIPPASVALTFVIKEGPKVKVGRIRFEGNKHVGSRALRRSMKNLRPIGIPHSIFLENLISKTYNAAKLTEDAERVRDAYQQRGYFKALVQDPKVQVRDTHGGLFHMPPFAGTGKAVDITMPIEEGQRYHLAAINFKGNKVLKSAGLRKLFPMKDGAIFNVELVRKGLENMRKAYGEFGYINFTSVPDTKINDDKKLITLDIDVDEGKQFSVRRIEFSGNTTTRDSVIRRELALEEGNLYNSRAWELSLLRLNQLGYFEPLKPEQDSEIKQNNQEGTVDITLKVKEKGKNSIGLTGGVSGLSGSFIGLTYETNNFLGRGETLRLSASIGSLARDLTLGFIEPYAFDRPLQLGFTVYNRKYDYNQAKQTAQLTGQNVNFSPAVLNALQNFSQSSTGFTASASYPLHRSFKRVGLAYSFDRSSITTFSQASQQYFNFLAFRGISGPNALQGIITSKITPSFSFSTVDNPMRPHTGHAFTIATDIAGIGGNVKSIRPVMEYKRFVPMRGIKPTGPGEGRNTLGFRVQGSFITGYGGIVAPPFDRFFLGGDTDIRGFDVRSITPYAFITNTVNVALMNKDGTLVPVDSNNPSRGNITIPIPVQQVVFTGGDTSLVGNIEYRIPIAGPVAIALFNDFGMNFAARQSQLRLSSVQISDLSNTVFGCPILLSNAPSNVCSGGITGIKIDQELTTIPGTNYQPRMSTGVELQIIMPVINAPLRVYWAYNPLRLNTTTVTPDSFNLKSMFPLNTDAGQFTFAQARALYAPFYVLKEPTKTFRFSVSTTF